MPGAGIPALIQFLEKEFGGRFNINQNTINVAAAPAPIVDHNFERLGLLIVNTGSGAANVAPQKGVLPGGGILLTAAGGFVSINYRDDLVLPGWEWSVVGLAAATTIYFLEIVRFKEASP